jgi:hypothetical protein
MKPANFPGRKNTRRKAALARMEDPNLGRHKRAGHPYYELLRKILPDEVAREWRTKKDRSARGMIRK